MKYAFLVAWREYSENAKTKGFWLGIFIMPLILFLSIQAPIWLEEKAAPIRYIAVVDQSGTLAPVIESRLESIYQQKVLEALHEYARKYSLSSTAHMTNPVLGEFADANPRSIAAFMNKGGKRFFLEQLQSRLKPGAPDFQEPRRLFQRVPLPSGIGKFGILKSFESVTSHLSAISIVLSIASGHCAKSECISLAERK